MTDHEDSPRRAARESRSKNPKGSKKRAGRSDSVTAAAQASPTDPDATVPMSTVTASVSEPAGDGGNGDSEKKGSIFARHPTASLVTISALVFALLGTGSVFAGVAVGSMEEAEEIIEETPPPPPPRPVPVTMAEPTDIRTCSIDAVSRDPLLLSFHGAVIDTATGDLLFDRSASTPAPTGSVLKVFTATAAIGVLGPDYRLKTRVYAGSEPGTMILVGGGDPTLSRLGAGSESVYRGAPKISTLASQALTKWHELYPDEPITDIVLDASLWNTADRWDSTWERSEQTIGYHSEVVALMVDGDRADPTKQTSPRSTDPAQRAGAAFVSALEGLGVDTSELTVRTGSANAGLQVLAEVSSQPVKVLIQQMLLVSDNTIAEMLARVISLEAGMDGSAASLNQVIRGAVTRYGIDMSAVTIRDGSGLSAQNQVPALVSAQLAARIWEGSGDLGLIYDSLPVAGQSGSLASRFAGSSADARGQVHAKTGWIKQARTLAGTIVAEDGTRLAFAFYAVGPVTAEAMAALDAVTAAAYRCGSNLSNN